jgi:hypothetical protein
MDHTKATLMAKVSIPSQCDARLLTPSSLDPSWSQMLSCGRWWGGRYASGSEQPQMKYCSPLFRSWTFLFEIFEERTASSHSA